MSMYELESTLLAIKDIPLPEQGPRTLPPRSFRLVNQSFRDGLPSVRNRIPQLMEQDVRVVKDAGYRQYAEAVRREIGHSHWFPLAAEGQAGPVGVSSQGKFEFATMSLLPGRPIFFTESFLTQHDGLPNAVTMQCLAYLLIHEHLHKIAASQEMALTSDHPMLQSVGLADYVDTVIGTTDKALRGARNVKYMETLQFVQERQPVLRVDGALAELYCLDEERGLRKFMDNGYDINEGVVELLAEEPRKSLLREIKFSSRSNITEGLIKILQDPENSTATVHRRRRDKVFIQEYLSKLGLGNQADIFVAFQEGRIPILHAEKFPNVCYS